MEGVIARGLNFYHNVTRSSDHEELVTTIENAITIVENPLAKVLSRSSQAERVERYPSHRDQAELDKNHLPFTGDAEDKPPFGWVLVNGDLYVNSFGCLASDDAKAWGYAFWDLGRLKRMESMMEIDIEGLIRFRHCMIPNRHTCPYTYSITF